MLTANALANPSSTETFPITFQPMQNIPSKAHQKAQNQRKHETVESVLANNRAENLGAKLEEKPSTAKNQGSWLDGELAASASSDQTVRLLDSATGAAQRTLKGHSDEVWGVAFSPDGRLVASASFDRTVRLWDSATDTA
jgi:WD40 repeat protein